MSKSGKSSRLSKLDHAAIVAAAGIAAAAAGLVAPSDAAEPMAPHSMMAPANVHMSTEGVTIHSDRLAAALHKNKEGTVRALQAQFPGLTVDQISVGRNNMVTFTISRAAFNQGVRPGMNTADNGVCNGGACAAPFLPGEEGFRE